MAADVDQPILLPGSGRREGGGKGKEREEGGNDEERHKVPWTGIRRFAMTIRLRAADVQEPRILTGG